MEHPLLRVHHPLEMTMWAFRVHGGNGSVLPSSDHEPEQQRREIFADIFQDDVQRPLVSVVMPVRGVIIEDENGDGNEEDVSSVAAHPIHHRACPSRRAASHYMRSEQKVDESFPRKRE
jgi:hypothetical protein